MEQTHLNPGDIILARERRTQIDNLNGWRVEVFKGVAGGLFQTTFKQYYYCIPFERFDPYDWERTRLEILKIKDGKIVKLHNP